MNIIPCLCFSLFRGEHSRRTMTLVMAVKRSLDFPTVSVENTVGRLLLSSLPPLLTSASSQHPIQKNSLDSFFFPNKTHWHLPICISTLVKRCIFKVFVKYFWHFVCRSQMLIWSWWMLVGTYLPSAFGLLSSMESIFSSWELNSHLFITAEVTQSPGNLPLSFGAPPT